jgi:UDP-N-acetylmuramoylalanine--D-glutamate ligase
MSIVIAGLGKTGVSCIRYLRRRGMRVAATDSRAQPPGLMQIAAENPDVPLRVGGFDLSLLEGASQLLLSPGLSIREPIALEARRRGIEVIGDIELFARAVRTPVVAVTGTNGKSTVTTLVAAMAAAAGRVVRAGGNLGQPALDLLDANEASPDLYVLELSSFQLECTSSLRLLAGVVLNVTADHMDRYSSLQDYADAKARIFLHAATAVLNADDPCCRAMRNMAPRTVLFSLVDERADFYFRESGGRQWLVRRGEPLLDFAELKVSGRHNAANALAALALGEAAGLPVPEMTSALRDFKGLPHRMQWVADIGAVRYLDDSKGTNVGATLAAVSGLPGPLVIIAGGDGKGQDFSPLRAAFAGKVRCAILIGRDRPALEHALAGVCPTRACRGMDEAVRAAAAIAQPGDTVLLSPACASLDMFRDYAERGEMFAAAVRGLMGGSP